jgi:hypothetical protein
VRYITTIVTEGWRVFTKRTLFICGAGTSSEAELPIGIELAQNIRVKCDVRYDYGGTQMSGVGDYDLFNDISATAPNKQAAFRQAALKIRNGAGHAPSIDDFLDVHRTDPDINFYGKAAIVKCILEAERASKKLYVPDGENFNSDQVRGTWFQRLMHMLGRGVQRESVLSIFNNVAFVVFNYDRCIEHFLFHALQNLCAIGDNEARSALEKLTIIHPYGTIGPIHRFPFGATSLNCAQLAGQIKTYTEQIEGTDIGTKINAELQHAERIVFLGFAFRGANMRFITASPKLQTNKNIYGTAFNMSDSDVEIIVGELAQLYQNVHTARGLIKLENKLKCTELFDYYAKSLSGD